MDLNPSTNERIFTWGGGVGGGGFQIQKKKPWNVLHGQEGFHLHSNQQGKSFHKHYHDQANI
jgi:hypothetical protein